ncbi:helix-turn-helix domain-containing protein [Acidocella sp.]|uniref:helix-turn-helix domain-containing protein n=1 Tax=Acidocella sp. TaxID=50710 RepID=UPI00180DFB31|nr:helix-turn-helix domain-containing protein [Acidocella sp.]NNM56308.1 helix-turn-helix domain-containing protein [Acidocella sp.]
MMHRGFKPIIPLAAQAVEMIAPDALKLSAAAQKIGIGEAELRKLVNRGEGPAFVMIGRTMLFRQATLEKWLAKREAQSLKVLARNRRLVRKFAGTTTGKTKGKV